jgi:hypothetical protein
MKVKLFLISFLTLSAILFSDIRDYSERDSEVLADSVKISLFLESVSSDIAKRELMEVLAGISLSRKIFKNFSVDIYSRQGHKYSLSATKSMTVSELLDLISDAAEKSRILRINKLELDNGNGGRLKLTDNSFKDLNKDPSYRKKEVVMGIIEETALKSDRKSSLEWIWGKSDDNDAYFSTKLTFFEDRFSFYPEYRMFVGNDPLRDKKSWFFALEDHPKPVRTVESTPLQAEIMEEPEKPQAVAETASESAGQIIAAIMNEELKESEDAPIQIVTEAASLSENVFDCGSAAFEDMNYETDYILYEKDAAGNLVSSPLRSGIGDLLNRAYSGTQVIKYIRLTSADFSYQGNETARSESESVIEITGDVSVCSKRLKAFLSEGMTGSNQKRSIEFITGVNGDKMSYNAKVLTVFDGNTSYFPEYKIYAPADVRKDKKSWFSRM